MKLPFAKLCGFFPFILCSLFCMFPAWANEDVVASVEYYLWTAPSVNISKPAKLIDFLGIPTDALDIAKIIVDKAITNNLNRESIDHKAYANQPKRPVNPKHECKEQLI